MIGVYNSMKKFINKCDLYFEGHMISKELLLRNYADFLAGNFEKKHNVAIALHTGSICFDIVTVLFSAMSNIVYNMDSAEDYINSLEIGEKVQYKSRMYEFGGFDTPGVYGKTIRLTYNYKDHGLTLFGSEIIPESEWNLLKPYRGGAKQTGRKVSQNDSRKRNAFISCVFDMEAKEIPAFIQKSSVIVMDRERAAQIIEGIEIDCHAGNTIKLTELMPISYFTENEEYPYGGNPGRIEPAIKITSNMSVARDLVTDNWLGRNNDNNWDNDVIGVLISGFSVISRARSEVVELMKRRKLKYVFISYNIASEDGETLLDESEEAEVFACTTEYLLNFSLPIKEKNPYTIELDKQVESVIDHETIPLAVKTFGYDWDIYRKVQIALSRLRYSGVRSAEEYVPLAYSVMNLIITSVFPFELMESLIEEGTLGVESPFRRIERLTEMVSDFDGEYRNFAQTVLSFLEDGYTKLLSDSPKKNVLFDLLEKNRGKKIAIIVPKAYYANILYRQKILEYFNNEKQLCISTANKFDYSQQYDMIIAIGAFWGKKFDPFRCRSAPTIYVMVSAMEENLFKYRRKSVAKIEQKVNASAKIPVDVVDVDEEIYSAGVIEEEVAEVLESTVDISTYINRIFETKAMEMFNNTSGSYRGTADISHIATCADGESIFFTRNYHAFVFDSSKEDVVEVPVDKLSPGDTIIFKSQNNEARDIVTTLLDKYLSEYNTMDIELQMAYWRSQHWKDVLKKYREHQESKKITFNSLAKRLEKFGSKKHAVTIQTWLSEDSYVVGPQDIETYVAIAAMTQDPEMLENPEAFCKSCEEIRRVRVGILKLIAKAIISKYSGKLTENGDMARVVSENINDISLLVQIDTITPVSEKKAPINMINRPISVN